MLNCDIKLPIMSKKAVRRRRRISRRRIPRWKRTSEEICTSRL